VLPMKSLLVLYSYHHNNTEKIANVFAKVLDAQIKTPITNWLNSCAGGKLLVYVKEKMSKVRNQERMPCIFLN